MISVKLENCSVALLRALACESKDTENIEEILKFNEDAVYKAVAENTHASCETLRYLYEKHGKDVIWSLVANISTPQDVLDKIANECGYEVARNLVKHTAILSNTIDVIVERFEDEKDVIKRVIDHENISAKTLIKIAAIYPELAEDILQTGKVKLVES